MSNGGERMGCGAFYRVGESLAELSRRRDGGDRWWIPLKPLVSQKKRRQGGTISGRGKEEAGRLNFLAWRAQEGCTWWPEAVVR
jgi:hypothetical protein